MNFNLTRLKKHYTFLFILCSVLNCYDGTGGLVRLSLSLMFPLAIIYTAIKPCNPNKQVRVYFFLSSLFVFLSLLAFLTTSSIVFVNVIGRTGILMLSILSIYASVQLIDLDKLISWFKIFSFIIISFTVIQLFWYFLTGSTISGHIPWLEVHNEQTNVILASTKEAIIYRPTSFFLEPSQIGLFLGMAMNVILFFPENSKNKNNIFYICIFLIGAVLSTSGTAIGLVLINIMLYIWTKQKNLSTLNQIMIWLVALFFVLITIAVFDKLYVFSRLTESESRYTSFLIYFKELDFIQQLVGVGIGNNVNYFSNILNMDWGFVSGFGLLLLQFGYIGVLITIIVYSYLMFISPKRCRPILILYLVGMSFENLLYGYWMIAFLSLAFFNFTRGVNNAAVAVDRHTD